ncbi:MAG: hypothetical protein HY903_04680 [Deltaproteobacteria bacterium]|nr:hypothetical protein [Deltaproteobacteria bacterium]
MRFAPPCPIGSFVDIEMGLKHACAASADGSIWCWGKTDCVDSSDSCFEMFQLRDKYVSVTTNGTYGCGVRDDGGIACWHVEVSREGIVDECEDPPFPPKGAFTEVAVGTQACGLRPDGSVECWGGH